MVNGTIIDLKSAFTSELMPVELMLEEFIKKSKMKECQSLNFNVPLNVVHLLDKIEFELT